MLKRVNILEYEKRAKKNRKKVIVDDNSVAKICVNYGPREIKTLIPHREPFLLIDSIDSVNFEEQSITGRRKIVSDDPIFKGHLPGYPIYPGVLQIEMIGQLGLCYHAFSKQKSVEIKYEKSALGIRFLKVLHALFQYEVLPDDEIKIAVKLLEADEYKVKGMGQIIKNNKICTVVIAEFYIV
jgi:3-hydroxyacyl-[acyl-carrier-protein] dehydratase